jgi:hypothetical protein
MESCSAEIAIANTQWKVDDIAPTSATYASLQEVLSANSKVALSGMMHL